jgi:hypothetical protein
MAIASSKGIDSGGAERTKQEYHREIGASSGAHASA